MLDLNGKRVVVTGGAGAIGTNLIQRLSQYDGLEVVVIDDLSSGVAQGLDFKKLFFMNPTLLMKILLMRCSANRWM